MEQKVPISRDSSARRCSPPAARLPSPLVRTTGSLAVSSAMRLGDALDDAKAGAFVESSFRFSHSSL